MSKYASLDARTELEQTVAEDFKAAFEKRGFTVKHNGGVTHAPAGVPDIEMFDANFNFNIEVTKRVGAQQDGEFNSIRDHLNSFKNNNTQKNVYCIFISPNTSQRMIDSIKDHNRQRVIEGNPDLKILPLSFETLELYLERLAKSEADLYPISSLINLFSNFNSFVDDLRIKKLLQQIIFPNDFDFEQKILQEEKDRDSETLNNLVKDLIKLENYMRENGVATGGAAINALIYLVFVKLYEEKRERENGDQNRFSNVKSFEKYIRNVSGRIRNQKRAIHELFRSIKDEAQFVESGMFTNTDNFPDSLNDDFIMEKVLPIFSQYNFLGTTVDALGAVYEVLALRSEKDVKVGQFFTPEKVVKFMVKMAELSPDDYVLDPACGTGRFLIHAMDDMISKINEPTTTKRDKKKNKIQQKQLFGADIDMRIAKIAKMNMWIHGDGKSNIKGEVNGITLHRNIKGFNDDVGCDNSFDVILTNPPLGELNYQTATFTDLGDVKERLMRIPILPIKNKTKEKRDTIAQRIEVHRRELEEMIDLKNKAELDRSLSKKELNSLKRKIENKIRTIENNQSQLSEIESQIASGNCEIEVTGNTMKGGALFLTAIWHYLKNNTEKSELPEWRGGKLLTILDEGILNTDNYKHVRDYIKTHFYIKAIISLTRDAFVPVSKTSTKTSILYAIKKTDLTAIQREPIFFAHVDKVGVDTKGKECENHLDKILEEYLAFKIAVINSYKGLEFRRDIFESLYTGGNK